MSLAKYSDTTDSGIDWLGVVPMHWSIVRLRHVAELNPSKSEVSDLDRELPVSFLPMEAVGDDGTIHLEQIRSIGAVENGYTYFREDDVTLAKITPCFENGKGAIMRGLLNGIGFGTTELIVVRPRPKHTTSDYLHWLFMSSYFRRIGESTMYGAGGQKRVPDDFVRNFTTAVPPLDEQKAISSFLDVETSKIDGLVSEQRRLIELLKEKRQAVISHAVTKGLNPNAPMKPSGIQWLGDVPQHWEVKPLRRFNCNVQTGPFGSQLHADEYISGGTPVVNPTHMVNGGIVPSDDITVNDDVLERLPHQRLEVGDVIFSRRGELGRCALVTERETGWLCGTGSMILRLHQAEYDGGYLSLFLSLDVLRQFFESFSIGSVMSSLSSETLLSMPLIVPPIEEQHQIVRLAIERATMIDQLEAEAERAIELLQERRTALISAAVSGKIDVRGFANEEAV